MIVSVLYKQKKEQQQQKLMFVTACFLFLRTDGRVVEGSGVFWYTQHPAYCSAVKNWSGYVNAVVEIFFDKEKLASSSAMGNQKKGRLVTAASH